MMEITKDPDTTSIGFCLLPTQLLQNILLRLCIPEIIRIKEVNKNLLEIVSTSEFVTDFNSGSHRDSWLFISAKRRGRDGTFLGLSNKSTRWFKIRLPEMLIGNVFPGEDLYLLTANGNFLLFASNTCHGIIAVDLVNKTVRRLPRCPLSPRGTLSWRRFGMKLISGPTGSGQFRFLFAEVVDNRPVLFVYDSITNAWESKSAMENRKQEWTFRRENGQVILNTLNRLQESIMISVDDGTQTQTQFHPVVLRPRFDRFMTWQRPSVIGLSRTDLDDQSLYIYGDGYQTVIELDVTEPGIKRTNSIEMSSISSNGQKWEVVSRAPDELIQKINKPCSVMKGCLERRLSIIRVVLMPNLGDLWDIIWLDYDKERDKWEWVPLPDCRFLQGSDLDGFSLSSGLTLPFVA